MRHRSTSRSGSATRRHACSKHHRSWCVRVRPAAQADISPTQPLYLLSRAELESLAERVIDALDRLDPDQDLELSGDETDGTGAEDDFAYPTYFRSFLGPGCEISDAA